MFPVNASCPKCGKSLLDSNRPIEGFPSIRLLIRYWNNEGYLWLSSLYGSYRGSQEMDVPEGSEVDVLCPFCKEILSDGPPCIECKANTVHLEIESGGSIRFCSRFGCQKHSIAFGDLGKIVVASIMNRYIVSAYTTDSLMTVAETLINYEIGGIPILDGKEKLFGFISEERVLELAYPESFGVAPEIAGKFSDIEAWKNISCSEIAEKNPVTAPHDTSLIDAFTLMMEKNINLLLIVKDDTLVGVLSKGDLSRALLREKIG